jgi:peroxiredoxin
MGDHAPTFALPDTDGATHEPGEAPATVVVFTCNHCPYALAWHERIIDVARDYANRGVRVLAVNANDAKNYPRDSLQAMRARVERGEFEGVPYLYEESQNVAGAYGAKTTPDVFVLDAAGLLRYRGAPDADHDNPAENAALLRGALDAVLNGRDPNPVETPPVGCSIKWKTRGPGPQPARDSQPSTVRGKGSTPFAGRRSRDTAVA